MSEPAQRAQAPDTLQRHQHPAAVIPAVLFSDDEAEQRWRQRFSAVRVSLPGWARDAPERTVYVSNETGRYEVSCWDCRDDVHAVATDRPDGTIHATLTPDGTQLWWFDDTGGDEFGSWRVQPFGSAPGSATSALPTVPPGYPAGLEVGTRTVLVGFSDDDGTRIHLSIGGGKPEVVYTHAEDGGVGALSTDETLWVLSHSEHGDSRYPALRALALPAGDVVGELSDGPGKGLVVVDFSPVAGDQRLLVRHERRGREELLIWIRRRVRSPTWTSTCRATWMRTSTPTAVRCSWCTPTPAAPPCTGTTSAPAR